MHKHISLLLVNAIGGLCCPSQVFELKHFTRISSARLNIQMLTQLKPEVGNVSLLLVKLIVGTQRDN